MTSVDWAAAIDVQLDDQGVPSLASVAKPIRAAASVQQLLTRSKVIRGLTESFAPFDCDPEALRARINAALVQLVRIGDLTQFQSRSGPGYVATPERWVDIGYERFAVLGAAEADLAFGLSLVRRIDLSDEVVEGALRMSLVDELGHAAWRLRLVEIGGADLPVSTPSALFKRLGDAAAGGERIEDIAPQSLRTLSGSGDYFGRYDANGLDGRWTAVVRDGPVCAVRRLSYGWRRCLVSRFDGRITCQDLDRDVWTWAVIGQTLAQGSPVYRWSPEERTLQMLTPPPLQVARLLDIAGEPSGAWRWSELSDVAVENLATYLGG